MAIEIVCPNDKTKVRITNLRFIRLAYRHVISRVECPSTFCVWNSRLAGGPPSQGLLNRSPQVIFFSVRERVQIELELS